MAVFSTKLAMRNVGVQTQSLLCEDYFELQSSLKIIAKVHENV